MFKWSHLRVLVPHEDRLCRHCDAGAADLEGSGGQQEKQEQRNSKDDDIQAKLRRAVRGHTPRKQGFQGITSLAQRLEEEEEEARDDLIIAGGFWLVSRWNTLKGKVFFVFADVE